MSDESNNSSIDDTISSFPESSLGSDANAFRLKYKAQVQVTQKLEDKIAGYKTVVQQLPKYQGTITQLRIKEEEQAKAIAYYMNQNEEQQKKILNLERLFQNFQVKDNLHQGLTELDYSHRSKRTPSQASSSPSFEIIGKIPSSHSFDKDLQNLLQQKTISQKQLSNAVVNTKRPDTLQYQEQSQGTFLASPQEVSGERKAGPVGHATGPPDNTFTLLRGLSSGSALNENNTFTSLNKSNSCPAVRSSFVSVFTAGNRKPQWLMEQEAFMKKSETSAEAVQQIPVSLVQALNSSRNSIDPYNNASLVSAATENQEALSNRSTRPKEWKPLNTMIPESKEQMNQYHLNPSDLNATFLGKSVLVKPVEISDYEFVKDFEFVNKLNDLSVAGKLTDDTFGMATRSESLTEFPSLHTNSPSPEGDQKKLQRTSSSICNQQNATTAFPTDKKSSISSQMESVLAKFGKNDSPVEMSDMLYKIAENSKNMESKLKEYKDHIKQLQVQIHQSHNMPNLYLEENSRLRDDNSALKRENDTLLEFVAALKMNKDTAAETEWIQSSPAQASTEPVRSHYPDSPMMKKIESLSIINAKLFKANKDWHNKWELLRQQTQEEKTDLESKVKTLETVNENFRNTIASLENDLAAQNATVQELMKANNGAEEEKASLIKVHEAFIIEMASLKSEVKDLRRNKKILEAELIALKNSTRNRDSQQAGHTELRSDIGLLKQQLTVFAEDFEKERKDRLVAESKADSLRRELQQCKLSQESRTKRMNIQIKTLENDLRIKARQNADLLYQIEDLKLRLNHEQRKSALSSHNAYSYQLPPASYEGPISLPYNSSVNGHMTNHNMAGGVNHLFVNTNPAPSSFLPHSSPEHLPGAWKCKHCTYVNYPNRSVCEICGYTVSNAESLPIAESGSGRNELQSRGQERKFSEGQDIVVDTA